jgi:cytochrome c-type biogenesis protein CcmH
VVWAVIALMTGAAVLCALWPLSRKADSAPQSPDIAFHKAQLAQIDADVERGMLPPRDAASARAEAARRLLAAADEKIAPAAPSPTRRRAAAILVVVGVPLLSLGVYARIGRPDLPDEPIATRAVDPNAPGVLEAAVGKMEAHLAAHPDDGPGYRVLAPVYLRMGRADDSARAFAQALRLLGEDAGLRADYGEALVAAANGIVTVKAREAMEQALARQPDLPKARYYVARAAEQDGDNAHALAMYRALAASAPKDAPWLSAVNARIAALTEPGAAPALSAAAGGPPSGAQADTIKAMAPAQQSGAIRGMVEGLDQRLRQNGDDPAGWLRLVRAWSVLGEAEKASAALRDARKAMAANPAAEHDLDALASELGIGGRS